MCSLGRADVSRPLPSFVTSTIVPVSAIAKFAPEMPTSASANFCRSARRANPASVSRSAGSRSPAGLLRISAICSAERWIAGATMCDGRCSAS